MSKIGVDDVPYLLIDATCYPSASDVQNLVCNRKSVKFVRKKEEKKEIQLLLKTLKGKLLESQKLINELEKIL